MRRLLAVLAAGGVLAATAVVAPALGDDPVDHVIVASGEGWTAVARRCGTTLSALLTANAAKSSDALHPGRVLHCVPAATTTTTTTTVAPTTAPETTTTTVAPTEPPTTTAAPTTTTLPPTTTVPPTEPPAGAFLEDFTGDTAITGLRVGSWHRAVETGFLGAFGGSWQADHADHGGGDCAGPTTTRGVTVYREPLDTNDDEVVFLCQSVDGDRAKAHLMATMGNVDGYSVVWFSPDRTFTDQTTVSWDVNVTDQGGRQWWEMAILPLSSPDVVAEPEIARDIASGLQPYPPGAVVVGNGPFGGELNIWANNRNQVYDNTLCYRPAREISMDPEGCASKAIRRPWTVTDNGNGTITVTALGQTWTVPGSFPDGYKVVWKSHAYTPDKDYNGAVPLPAFTWHFDNLSIS